MKRSTRAAGSSGSARRTSSTQACVDGQRHEVGLGEVAVVVGLFLGAQRRRGAGLGVEMQGLLARSVPPASRTAIWRGSSASRACCRNRKLFMFLSSVRVPSRSLPAGRTLMLASQRIWPSSMLHSLTPRPTHQVAELLQELAGRFGRRYVGLADDLDERRAAAVEVDHRVVGAGDAAGVAARVDQLGGVFFHVHPVDAAREQLRRRPSSRTSRPRPGARRTG